MWQVGMWGEVLTEFWWGNVKERDHSEHLVLDGRVILKLILYNNDGKVRIWFIQLSLRTNLAVVNKVMDIRLAQNERTFLTSWGNSSFSGRNLLRGYSYSNIRGSEWGSSFFMLCYRKLVRIFLLSHSCHIPFHIHLP
jgi:hypothetical protein